MSTVHFQIFDTADAVVSALADYVAEAVQHNPEITLGLATGNTFRPVYAALVERYKRGGLSFSGVASFNLDEYVGLPKGHPSSFRAYMQELLFEAVDIAPTNAHLPAVEGDIAAGCTAYEAAIAARGGIDLQLLGIGRNGHIGFNEPGASFDSRTRLVDLTPSTIDANSGDFPLGETPPPAAVTIGIGTILDTREIVLAATGEGKIEALRRAFDAPPNEACPASALQHHPKVTVLCDRAARSY